MEVIEELDAGMRAQFQERFALIQTEFDKAFKQLFGGGRGSLELVEDEDILEAGIRIIAQPPGKKAAEYDAAFRWREGSDSHIPAVRHSESGSLPLLSAG